MKLQDQVISLKYAQKLKKLGVKQESIWYWIKDRKDKDIESNYELWLGETLKPWEVDKEIVYSAFTVAELGEMLPLGYASWRNPNDFMCESGNEELEQRDNTEANARAKMLIYLIENKLLKHKP